MSRPRTDTLIDWVSRYGTVACLVLLLLGFSLARPEIFPTLLNLLNILNQVSILAIIAIGLTVCLVMGLFDLSIAAMATFGGYLVCKLLVDQGDQFLLWPTILLVLAVSAAIGVVNGVLVGYFGISAFIETLAMGSIITGAILGYSDSRTILGGIPDPFLTIGQASTLGIPNPVLVMALVAITVWVLLEHTPTGRNLYAIGGNAEATRLAGIPVKRHALIAMGVSALCAALGGMMAAANLGAGRPQGVGDTYLLNAFAAVFIGASSLRPGQFHVLGTMIGVLLIGVINNGLSVMGAPTYWQYIVQGTLLIVAMFGAGLLVMRRR
jgi:ribose transport system permease protein